MKLIKTLVAAVLLIACPLAFSACFNNGDIPLGTYKPGLVQIGDNSAHRFAMADMYSLDDMTSAAVVQRIANKLAEFGVTSDIDSNSLAYKIKNYYEFHAGLTEVAVASNLITIDARRTSLGLQNGSKASEYTVDSAGLIVFQKDMSAVKFEGTKDWSFKNNEIYMNQNAIDSTSYSFIYKK
ncbi:MAG: hypothetical protein FWE53_00415 [Firmicutes bacterium]|nr:hypothetical protein [Bacillota bacterium]